jgi:endonuclease YncB( thermonuclease family)
MRAIASVLLALATTAAAAQGGAIIGTATIIDADALEIHSVRVRLRGIDAPESSQQCTDAAGVVYLCG